MTLKIKTIPYDKENDALRNKCTKYMQENLKITDMLFRCLEFIDNVHLDMPGYKTPKDIQEWWMSRKGKK